MYVCVEQWQDDPALTPIEDSFIKTKTKNNNRNSTDKKKLETSALHLILEPGRYLNIYYTPIQIFFLIRAEEVYEFLDHVAI